MKNLLERIKQDERGEGSIRALGWMLVLGMGAVGSLALIALVATGTIG